MNNQPTSFLSNNPEFALAQAAAIVEFSDDAIVSKNLHGVVLSWNRGAESLFGYTAQEMIGQPIHRLIPADRCHEETQILERLHAGDRIDHYETVRQRKDGRLVEVSLTVSPLKDRAGRIIGASKIARDISQRKQAERQLKQLAADSEQLVIERTHELRCSQDRLRALASELTLTEQRERRRLATELHDYLAQLVVASRINLSHVILQTRDKDLSISLTRIDHMLDQALTYTRSLVAELSPHILYQFGLPKSLVWLGDQMKQHGLEVAVQTGPGSLALPDDQAVLLFQSVRELLFNIVKHAQTDKASITITIDADNELWICVEDQGNGFEVATLSGSGEAHSKFGLLTIRERMQLLGGECELSSCPGVGTLAILRLPLAQTCVGSSPHVSTPATEVETVMERSPGRCLRILLVDDHAMVRQGLRSILDSYPDLDVVGEAADGQDAVIMARSLHPDVVVMDVNLPLLDGIEATRILCREQGAITVIGISVRNDPQVKLAMTDAGAVDFLPKESAASRLYEVILNHCPVTS